MQIYAKTHTGNCDKCHDSGGARLHEHWVVVIIKKKHVINILDFTDVVLGYEQQRTSRSTISIKKIQRLEHLPPRYNLNHDFSSCLKKTSKSIQHKRVGCHCISA